MRLLPSSNSERAIGVEQFIQNMNTLDPLLVYTAIFCVAFIENIFPPSPSDIAIVCAGALVSLSRIGFVEALLACTTGSVLGFVVVYKIGDWFGVRILEQGKVKFVSVEGLRTVESWFRRYGYWIIVANRFLAGTRAIVSFFAGMSKLDLLRTTLLSILSAGAWNAILLGSGYTLGNNWQRIGLYLTTYSQVVTAIVVLLLIVWFVRYLYGRKKNGAEVR